MNERLVVLSTVAKVEDAEWIAQDVVGKGLAACVNVVSGVLSVYRWKGALQRDNEVLLVMKTRAEQFEALRQAIVANHPYEIPEVIALPVQAGHEPYLAWLDETVGSGRR